MPNPSHNLSGTDPLFEPFSVHAVNLAEHADNPVHTDAGAKAAGFDAALVAGTTIYAYLTNVPTRAWGLDWVASGGGELRLRRPVLERDPVICDAEVSTVGVSPGSAAGTVVHARVGRESRASLSLWSRSPSRPERRSTPLGSFTVELDEMSASYAHRAGDSNTLCADAGVVHPVIWANLSNRVFVRYLVTGPWVHVRSRIHHFGLAPVGSEIVVNAALVDRFESRAGERALVDIDFMVDGNRVAYVEHEAIITLA